MRVILAVGCDSMIQTTRISVLQTGGYLVKSACSATEAFCRFCEEHFDLVVLCHSVPDPDRESLVRQIRRVGSSAPILCVMPIDGRVQETFGEVTVNGRPGELLCAVDKALNKAAAPARALNNAAQPINARRRDVPS